MASAELCTSRIGIAVCSAVITSGNSCWIKSDKYFAHNPLQFSHCSFQAEFNKKLMCYSVEPRGVVDSINIHYNPYIGWVLLFSRYCTANTSDENWHPINKFLSWCDFFSFHLDIVSPHNSDSTCWTTGIVHVFTEQGNDPAVCDTNHFVYLCFVSATCRWRCGRVVAVM